MSSSRNPVRARLRRDDRAKLDEYLDSLRATERRTQLADKRPDVVPDLAEPAGIPKRRGDYIKLMMDLIVLAFKLDLTRVATLVIDLERWDSPRLYDGVFDNPLNHHGLTRTKGEDAREKIAKIDRFHIDQYAYLVERLAAIKEGERSLLDHSAVVIGSGISVGDTHNYKDLPAIVAGRAGGSLDTGAFRNHPGERPLADLWLSLLHAFGSDAPRFADSTGVLPGLLA